MKNTKKMLFFCLIGAVGALNASNERERVEEIMTRYAGLIRGQSPISDQSIGYTPVDVTSSRPNPLDACALEQSFAISDEDPRRVMETLRLHYRTTPRDNIVGVSSITPSSSKENTQYNQEQARVNEIMERYAWLGMTAGDRELNTPDDGSLRRSPIQRYDYQQQCQEITEIHNRIFRRKKAR